MKIFSFLIKAAVGAILPSVAIIFASCNEDPEPFKTVPHDTFWEVVTPASQHMDNDELQRLRSVVSLQDGVYSFLIVRNGKIVHEQYHNGAKVNSLLHTRSITKRITATLAGIGIDKGELRGDDALIRDFFPEIDGPAAGKGWEAVAVAHLLNMISGMEWIESNELNDYEGHLDNPLTYIFKKDILHVPGTYYSYNSPGFDLLSYVVERSGGQDVGDYAEENLFGPLGISGYEWEEVGDGTERGGTGLQLTARDLAKIGLLYLQNGQWQGQQIVSSSWIEQCFAEIIHLDDLGGEHIPGIAIGQSWWTRDNDGNRIHYGDGYGGQVLVIVPMHNMVVVMNRAWRVDGGRNSAAFNFFFGELLPAVLESVE